MATKAFVLIETEVSRSRDVVERIRGGLGVESVDVVIGAYDVIAVVSGGDLNAIGDLVTQEIHTVPGVVRTVTCLAVGATN